MILELVLAGLMSQSAHASNSSDDAPEVTESLSQAIRSNAAHYWTWAAKNPLPKYSSYEGIVAGDAHMGNFSVVPVVSSSGRRDLRFVDIDFDDAGKGSFALDFARLAITIKTVDKDVKYKDIVGAYVDGLNGKSGKAPDRVKDALAMPNSEYDQLDAKYVDKKTSHGKFKLDAGELQKYSAKYSLSDITRLFPKEKVLDVATRPQERGGSASAVRIWVLTEASDGAQHISEIKGYEATAMLKFEAQDAPQTLVKKVQSVFWQGLDKSSYDLVTLAGDLVWVRPKKVPLLDIPYKLKSASDQVFVADLSLYDANLLGQIHGGQNRSYANAVSKDPDAFKEALKALAKAYIDYAKKTLQ